MKYETKTGIDYEAVAEEWFGQRELAGALKSVIREAARQAHDSEQHGTPSQRRAKLQRTAAAAAKLKVLLSGLDFSTRTRIFGAGEIKLSEKTDIVAEETDPSAPTNVLVLSPQAAQNGEALYKLSGFGALLDEFVVRAQRLAHEVDQQSAGAPNLPDAISFGVECLISFWLRYRSEPPTSGKNNNSFGYLAELLLCAPPMSAEPRQVGTALRYYFKKTNV
jgi:hypothetical protein